MVCYSINLLSINFERDQYSSVGGTVGVSDYYDGYRTAILDEDNDKEDTNLKIIIYVPKYTSLFIIIRKYGLLKKIGLLRIGIE